jgi:hypothetical protein
MSLGTRFSSSGGNNLLIFYTPLYIRLHLLENLGRYRNVPIWPVLVLGMFYYFPM